MKKKHTNEPNYTKLVMPRQLVLPLDYGILIKETAPVRLLDAVLEELDGCRNCYQQKIHPMLSKHFIEWVYVQTENGGQRKALKPDDKPNVTFCLGDDKAVAVYAYCNLHGLWMTEV